MLIITLFAILIKYLQVTAALIEHLIDLSIDVLCLNLRILFFTQDLTKLVLGAFDVFEKFESLVSVKRIILDLFWLRFKAKRGFFCIGVRFSIILSFSVDSRAISYINEACRLRSNAIRCLFVFFMVTANAHLYNCVSKLSNF